MARPLFNESLGDELITNGGFGSDTTGWTDARGAVLASITGGQSGNCLEITCNGQNNPYAYQDITIITGKIYKLQFYVKQGTESTWRYELYDVTNSASYYLSDNAEATASWVQHTFYATAPAGCSTLQIRLRQSASAGSGTTILYDTVIFKEVTHAGFSMHDGNLSSGGFHNRDYDRHIFSVKNGSRQRTNFST